jgi:hypothetical protein
MRVLKLLPFFIFFVIHYTQFRKYRHIYGNNNNYVGFVFNTKKKFTRANKYQDINYKLILLTFID